MLAKEQERDAPKMIKSLFQAILAALVVTSCAHLGESPLRPICLASGWATQMAGPEAVDCGTDHYDASPRQLKTMSRCIERGLDSRKTVVFGHMAATPDSGECGFAILRNGSKAAIAEYSYDFSFPKEDPRFGSRGFVGECERIVLAMKRTDSRKPYESIDCTFDSERYDALMADK